MTAEKRCHVRLRWRVNNDRTAVPTKKVSRHALRTPDPSRHDTNPIITDLVDADRSRTAADLRRLRNPQRPPRDDVRPTPRAAYIDVQLVIEVPPARAIGPSLGRAKFGQCRSEFVKPSPVGEHIDGRHALLTTRKHISDSNKPPEVIATPAAPLWVSGETNFAGSANIAA